jgi:hypothetical protein
VVRRLLAPLLALLALLCLLGLGPGGCFHALDGSLVKKKQDGGIDARRDGGADARRDGGADAKPPTDGTAKPDLPALDKGTQQADGASSG